MRHCINYSDDCGAACDMRLAADEIRIPALQLLGHAEALAADSGPAILTIAQQLLALSDDLHDSAARAPSERLSLEPEHVRVGTLVRDVIASVSAMLGGRRHWRVAPNVAPLALRADRRALHQVLTRVLSNAARFSGEGDWIDVDLRSGGDHVTLVVQDEGNPPALSIGLNTDRRGLGRGLLLSRQLMRAHGGSLAVESAPGVGTCVTLRFPAALVVEAVG